MAVQVLKQLPYCSGHQHSSTSTLINNVNCFGNSTGAATVNSSGGTGPYSYIWSTSATTSVITGLNAGVRTVYGYDANSCTISSARSPTTRFGTPLLFRFYYFLFWSFCGAATVTASGGHNGYTLSLVNRCNNIGYYRGRVLVLKL